MHGLGARLVVRPCCELFRGYRASLLFPCSGRDPDLIHVHDARSHDHKQTVSERDNDGSNCLCRLGRRWRKIGYASGLLSRLSPSVSENAGEPRPRLRPEPLQPGLCDQEAQRVRGHKRVPRKATSRLCGGVTAAARPNAARQASMLDGVTGTPALGVTADSCHRLIWLFDFREREQENWCERWKGPDSP